HGLLQNDALVFHNLAVDMAARISAKGWSEWSMFPPGATGNVGLLAALYALFWPDPAWFIPFNAAAHAAGAAVIYRLGYRLWPGVPGQLGGLIAGIAFLTFPSSLQWYGQNHKDAFAILGTLLVLETWCQSLSITEFDWRRFLLLLIKAVAGVLLVGLVRPYYVVLLSLGFSVALIVDSLMLTMTRRRLALKSIAWQLTLLVVIALAALAFAHSGKTIGVYGVETVLSEAKHPASVSSLSSLAQTGWHWHESLSTPAMLEKTLRRASELRAHFVGFGRQVGAHSEIDGERLPNNSLSALAYLPRALFVGLLAPFPDSWSERVTLPRLIGAMETAVWYLFAIGIVLIVWRRPSRELLAGMLFCGTLLMIIAYIHPNIGTLYRQRYGLWLFFLLCGSVGWFGLIADYLRQAPTSAAQTTGERTAASVTDHPPLMTSAGRLASAGFVVVLITLTCYLGFFARDLLMIQYLGMAGKLDAFFTATMIPMFFVTCFAMPMADALTPTFIASNNKAQLLEGALGLSFLVLAGAMLLVIIFAPWLAGAVLGGTGSQGVASTSLMLRWFAPILPLSALTVLGNAALNALGRQRDAALGQLFVPAITLILLSLTSASNAAAVAIGGLLLGTLLNVLWIAFRFSDTEIRFIPRLPSAQVLSPILEQYRRLVLAALLPAALVPLNYAFAATVSTGAVSAWAFASKIIILFSGLSSVAATAVVLPHLSRLFAHAQRHSIRRDANFLFSVGGWFGGLLAVGGFVFAEPLVGLVLSREVGGEQLLELANVVKVGVVQLPMVISWALIAKMAIVSGNSPRVTYAALLGFGVNLLVNLSVVPLFGVLGVAMGSLAAIFASTLLLLLSTYRRAGLVLRDLLMILGGWAVCATVCLALAAHTAVGLLIASLFVVALVVTQCLLLKARTKTLLEETATL
ncbi:MAG: lipid II flippase MurJ, partial [Pseudomonadota bacterium]